MSRIDDDDDTGRHCLCAALGRQWRPQRLPSPLQCAFQQQCAPCERGFGVCIWICPVSIWIRRKPAGLPPLDCAKAPNCNHLRAHLSLSLSRWLNPVGASLALVCRLLRTICVRSELDEPSLSHRRPQIDRPLASAQQSTANRTEPNRTASSRGRAQVESTRRRLALEINRVRKKVRCEREQATKKAVLVSSCCHPSKIALYCEHTQLISAKSDTSHRQCCQGAPADRHLTREQMQVQVRQI